MTRHGRVPVLAVLDRLGAGRDRYCWTARCLDGQGHRAIVVVRLGFGFVSLESPSFGLLYFAPAHVGRLRAVLRSAVITLGKLGGAVPTRPAPAPPRQPPIQRRRTVPGELPYRPTVADVIERVRNGDAAELPPGTPADTVDQTRHHLVG
jgi:hypothetical protein